MVRELRRLLIEPARLERREQTTGRLPLEREEDHYLARVLRLRPGDPVLVVDGSGGLWQGQRGEGPWLEALQPLGPPQLPPAPRLCLALALPRQDVELVWRMATELGIDRLQPLLADRCQGSGRRPALERWSAVVREATEQCERLWLPHLETPQTAATWFAAPRAGLKLLATTRREQLPALEACLSQAGEPGSDLEEIFLAIGPEGGWSPREEELAEAAGWCAAGLGATILRTTTAAVAGVSRLAAWRQLSC
jgi:16S rRNA (uracil1498-N3)-methyltransferase